MPAKKTPPPPTHKPATQKQYVTEQIRRMAFLVSDTPAPDGASQTNGEQLARTIWQEALGWTEKRRDDAGREETIVHPPVMSMQEKLMDRLDGKILAAPEGASVGGIRAAEKVRGLAVERLNALAKEVTSVSPKAQE